MADSIAGVGTRRLQQLAIEDAAARLVVPVLLDVQRDRRHVARVEAGIRAPRRLDAARRQSGADQEQERDRHLRDHETRPQPSSRRAARRRVFVDDRHQIDPRALQRRDESEHERAPAGDQRRETDDEAVDADIEEDALEARRATRRTPTSTGIPRCASRTPSTAPGTARTRFSTISSRTIRVRVAPSARRTAISPRRDTPRTRTSPAMFAHAISRTSRPIALSTVSVGSMCIGAPPGVCQNGTTLSRCATSVSGRSRESAAQSASVCAAAFASVMPGRR